MHGDISRNKTRFQGIQTNTKGTLRRTEWYANVQRQSMEDNENPRNTNGCNDIPRNTRRHKRNTKQHGMVCEFKTKRYANAQRASKEYSEIPRNTKEC